MSKPRVLSQIEIVDDVLRNLRSIGHDPDEETVQFVWKIVKRQATPDEISAWKKASVSELRKQRDIDYERMTSSEAFWRAALLKTSAAMLGLTNSIDKAAKSISAVDNFDRFDATNIPI